MFHALYYIMGDVRETINNLSLHLRSFLFLPEVISLFQANRYGDTLTGLVH